MSRYKVDFLQLFVHTQVGIAQFSTSSALVLTETGEDGLEWRPAITSGSKAMEGRKHQAERWKEQPPPKKITCPQKRDCFNIYIYIGNTSSNHWFFRCYVTSVSFREGFQPFWFRRSPPYYDIAGVYSWDFCLLGSPVSTKNSHTKSPLLGGSSQLVSG